MKITKGSSGYIRYRRKQQLMVSAALLLLVVLLYLIPLRYFETNKNIFSIMAALLALPAAKFIVNTVMFFRAPCCTEDLRRAVIKTAPHVPGAFDLYLTSYSKNFALSHTGVLDNSLIAISQDPSCDISAAEAHIRRMLQQSGCHGYSIRVFGNAKSYLTALARMEGTAAQKNTEQKKADQALSALKAVAL